MTSTTELDDRIRDMKTQLDRATPQAPAFDELSRMARQRPARLLPIAAAASIVVLGVGGLLAVATRSENPTPPQSAPTQATLDDPLGISLDERADPDNAVNACPCVVLDLADLPDSWTAETISAGFDLVFSGYRSSTILSHPDHEGVVLTLQSWTIDSPSDATGAGDSVVTIGEDSDAKVSSGQLVWQPDDGLQAFITVSDESETDTVLELARNLRFVSADQLPDVAVPEPLAPMRDAADAELAGTINGHRWQLDVGPATAISVNLAVDGIGIDAMSREGGDPAPGNTIDMSIAAIGNDTIVYGRTPPTTAGLTVEIADQPNVNIPIFRRSTDTVFGVPIPAGLDITGLAFTDDAGNVLHRVLIPELPTPVLSMGLPAQTFNNPAGQALI